MRRTENGKRGLAAVEFALLLPMLVCLLLLILEGSQAIHTYSALVDASREGARHVLVRGDAADVQSLVASLVDELDDDQLSTVVTTDAQANTVTVEISYGYSLFGDNVSNILSGEEGDETFTLVAQTTMPLP